MDGNNNEFLIVIRLTIGCETHDWGCDGERILHSKKQVLYRISKKASVDDKKLANAFKVSKTE